MLQWENGSLSYAVTNHVGLMLVAFGSQKLRQVTDVLAVRTAKPIVKTSDQPLRRMQTVPGTTAWHRNPVIVGSFKPHQSSFNIASMFE